MDYFTTRNAVIVALVQTGVIVAAVLAAGAAYKWHVSAGLIGPPPAATTFVSEHGHLFLVVPVAWIAVALWVLLRSNDEAGPPWLTFLSGVLIVLLLLVAGAQASAVPLFRLLCGCGGLSN